MIILIIMSNIDINYSITYIFVYKWIIIIIVMNRIFFNNRV